MHDDIIAAIATGYVESAIAVIRVSGYGCYDILKKIFSRKKINFEDKRIYYGHILDENGSIVDEVLVSIFRSPHSYTGEDSFEISCHGGLMVSNAVLQIVLNNGARMARPGEFTKRAFLNGKMDLSQAEAVAKVISAKSSRALHIAQLQLKGNFSNEIGEIRKDILLLLAENEVNIDYVDEELSDFSKEKRLSMVNNIYERLSSILRASQSGKSLFDGMKISIVGKPNVGKSSLLNKIIGIDRSIVTDIPGTTRDVVSEQITIKGIPFTLLDTAGIRKSSDDVIENLGIERTVDAIKKSDIILALFDLSSQLNEEDYDIINRLQKNSNRVIAILNKYDKKSGLFNKGIIPFKRQIQISCKTGYGLKELANELEEIAIGNIADSDIVSMNASQITILKQGMKLCKDLLNDIKGDIDPSLISVEITGLIDILDEIIGKITTEDMLDVMFRNFCVGK